MTIRSAVSKLLPIMLKLWGVDTTTPLGRYERHGQLARVGARPIYTRNGVRVSISHGREWAGENGGYVPRRDD